MCCCRRQYAAKQVNESKYLAKVSGELLDQGDRKRATQVALQALPEDVENPDRPVVNEAGIRAEQFNVFVSELRSRELRTKQRFRDGKQFRYIQRSEPDIFKVRKPLRGAGQQRASYMFMILGNNKAAEIKMSDLDPETAAKQADSGIEGMCFISDDKMILNYGSEIICVKISDKGGRMENGCQRRRTAEFISFICSNQMTERLRRSVIPQAL
jgi:hypothetical protein